MLLRRAAHGGQAEVAQRLAGEGEGAIAAHRLFFTTVRLPRFGVGEGAGHRLARRQVDAGRVAAVGAGRAGQVPAGGRGLADAVGARQQVGEGALRRAAVRWPG